MKAEEVSYNMRGGNTLEDTEVRKKKKILIAVIVLILVVLIVGVTTMKVTGTSQRAKINRMMKTAQKFLNEMQYEQAIAAFDTVLEIEPKHLPAYMGKAETYVAMDDVDSAVSTMNKAERIAREEYESTGKKLDKVDKMYELYVQILKNDGRFENAINIIEEAKKWLQDDNLEKILEDLVGKTIDMNVPDAKIAFEDPVLEKDIRKIINKPDGDIMISDVWYVEEVKICGDYVGDEVDVKTYTRGYYWSSDNSKRETSQVISTLNDLYYFRNLKKLTVNYHEGVDISVLADSDNFPNLRMISFVSDGLKDISQISGLTFLTSVSFDLNDITDFTPLAMLTRLSYLSIASNKGMHSTEKLDRLTYLKSLSAWGIDDVDVGAVASLPNLKSLQLSSGDYSKLADCHNLTSLEINVNGQNIQYLAGLTNKCRRLRVHISSKVNDISVISKLTWLESLDLMAYFGAENNVYDLSVIAGMSELKKLELGNAKYSNYSVLNNLPKLEKVYIDKGSTSVIEEVKKVISEEKINVKD